MSTQKPAVRASAITTSDTALNNFRSLYVGGAGNVAVILRDDTTAITFLNVPAGSILPVQVSKVMATNTTATNIIGLL